MGTHASYSYSLDTHASYLILVLMGTYAYDHRVNVKVPTDLPPGKYVLGFRYDCEMTSQVWSSCADIQIA